MEAQTDLQSYLEQGKQALAQGKGREAALAYAHSAQIEPNNPQVHLGLAEANLALGSFDVVRTACRRVQELQSQDGTETKLAQALLDLLDHRYERALQNVDAAISEDPIIGYAHALRAYLLRANGQDYDANLARARATRLSYGGRFENCFPPLEVPKAPGYTGPSAYTPATQPAPASRATNGDSVPAWSRPNGIQRQIIRTRFALSRYPTLVTTVLIAINVLMFLLTMLSPTLYNLGLQDNNLVLQGQVWRIFTAMFLHESIEHIGLNMLSLFFIGRAVEIFYGQWRYLVIYLLSGIMGGILFLFLSPGQAAVGASGAIFGVFGALGVFYILNRRSLGAYGPGAIGNWLFWLVLNLGFDLYAGSSIAIWGHVGGIIAGMILAFLLLPRSRRGRMTV